MFVMETKCGSKKLEYLKHKIGYPNMFCVNSIGRKEGLVMLWKVEENIEVINYSNHHIHLSVKQANSS